MKMEIHGMMDEPGRFDSIEKWELHLERVKRLPKDALEREPMICRAQLVIAEHRKHAVSRKKTD